MTKVSHNVDAEKSIIGSMMLSAKAVDTAIESLSSKDFYSNAYAILFDAIIEVYTEGLAPDALVLADYLERTGKLNAVGGKQAIISAVSAGTPSAINSHIKIVKTHSTARSIVTAADNIREVGNATGFDVDSSLAKVENIVSNLSGISTTSKSLSVSDTVADLLDNASDDWISTRDLAGVSTGINRLDEMLSGLRDSTLTLVGARPACGKTALAVTIAAEVAVNQNLPVVFFSLEMGANEIGARILSNLSGVGSTKIEKGILGQYDWLKLRDAVVKLDKCKLIIDDDPLVSVAEISRRCKKIKNQYGGLGLVIIDYLQLMTGAGENRQVEVSNISRGLKILSRELECPLLALSQLSRGLEARADKRPMLSDLRESGALEQDSDVVAFLYRDEVYNDETPYVGHAEIIVAKNRRGETGTFRVGFLPHQSRFANFSNEI